MASTTVVPAVAKQNGFVSFLKHFGHKAEQVLGWLASPANQKIVIAAEETGADIAKAVEPGLAPAIQGGLNLAELFTKEIFKAETIGAAAAAADPTATNEQKAVLVVSAVAPDAFAFARANGLAMPTGDRLLAANNAIVAFWNAIAGPAAAQPAQPAS